MGRLKHNCLPKAPLSNTITRGVNSGEEDTDPQQGCGRVTGILPCGSDSEIHCKRSEKGGMTSH